MGPSVRNVGDVLVVDLEGQIALGKTADALLADVAALLEAGNTRILLNLAEVPWVDSVGLTKLVSSLRLARTKGAQLKLLNPSPRVANTLRLTQLSNLFEIFTDEAEAVRSFQSLTN